MFRNFRKKDLATLLEERADQLEKIYNRNNSAAGFKKLSKADNDKIVALLPLSTSTGLNAQIESFIDEEIARLEKAGMRTDPLGGAATNIFADYKGKHGDKDAPLDVTVFRHTDHFGKVIKEAYQLKSKTGVDVLDKESITIALGVISSESNQAHLRQLKRYKSAREMERKDQSDNDPMDNLVQLREDQQSAFLESKKVLRDLNHIAIPSGIAPALMPQIQETAASQLDNVIKKLREQAQLVRKIKNANCLMSAKEFQSATSVLGAIRPPELKEIDKELHVLQGTSSGLPFWKKSDPQYNAIDEQGRLNRLMQLLPKIYEAEKKAGVQYSAQRKAGLTQLRTQVEYAIFQAGTKMKISPDENPLAAYQHIKSMQQRQGSR